MADDEWNDDPVEFDEGAGNGPNGEVGNGPDDRTGDSEADATDDDSEWRFTLEDLAADDEEGDDEDGVSLYAEIEAGSPSAEGVLFVGLGLAFGLLVVWQLLL